MAALPFFMLKIKITCEDKEETIIVNRFKKLVTDFDVIKCKFCVLEKDDSYKNNQKDFGKISGIYRIYRNNKSYIGQAKSILERWDNHIMYALKNKSRLEFHRTLKKHLPEFTFEIVEVVNDLSKLSEREIFWIDKFDSFRNGFNKTKGGDGVGHDFVGEKHHNCKTTEAIVREIRLLYAEKKKIKHEVYEDFKDRIKFSAFSKIWEFETWKHVLPELNTQENAQWHKTHFHFNGNGNPRKLLSFKEMDKIRIYLKQNLSDEEIYANFRDYNECNFMKQLALIKQHTNEEIDFLRKKKATDSYLKKSKITESEVALIRLMYFEGCDKTTSYDFFKDKLTFGEFHGIWCGYKLQTISMYVYDDCYKEMIANRRYLRTYNLTVDDVKNIRNRKDEKKIDVFNDFKDKISFSVFNKIWCGHVLKTI